ncbi:hypothetical protein DSL72_007600 [Monilinia vaccinii-corymbosi]|uniref:Uncharacterized protein n=1 Tax=Monilinia vaccinii-corymbosi TaxID=61207 RepID=A0A8A3PI80_9HELO|nr:hypothetical protein DSL72_007600 [Monilinia vaccinii-corymbosi]
MHHIPPTEVSSSSPIAPSTTTSSVQEARQNLLQRIHEYNTDINTPPDLRVHITGLTLEEGAIFERGLSSVTEDPGFQTPTGSPSVSPPLSSELVLDTDGLPSKAPGSATVDAEHGTQKSMEEITRCRARQIKIRDLQREKETLEMERRRRAAKEQVGIRWKERALKDWKENKAKNDYHFVQGADGHDEAVIKGVHYPNDGSGSGGVSERIKCNFGRGENVNREVVIARGVRNSGNERQVVDVKSNEKRTPPKAPKGLKRLAESRRKANQEWIAKEGQRLAVRGNDERTANNLLMDVNRAIAVAAGVAWNGAEHSMDFANGDGPWKNTTELGIEDAHEDSRVRVGYPLENSKPGHAPPLPARLEPKSKTLLGKGHGSWSPELEECGRRRAHRTRDTSPQSQATERHAHHHQPRANDLPESHHRGRRAAEDSKPSTRKLSPPQAPPFHKRREHAHGAVGDVSKSNFRPVQAAEINSPGDNVPIPLMSPLVPKVEKVKPKPEPTPPVFPAQGIRDSRLLPNESPAQWKVRTLREKAHGDFERDKLMYKEEAKAVKNNVQAGPTKAILKRDGKGKGKAIMIAWAVEPPDNKGEDEMSPIKHTPSFNERADQEELRKLEEKRNKRDGNYRCFATGSKIERENLAARERAEELADTLMRGEGGTEGFREAGEE